MIPFLALDDVVTKSRHGETMAHGTTSLAVHKGEALAIVGHKGAGKRALLRLIAGMDAPASGRISVEGRDLSTFDYASMRDHRTRIGFVFEVGAFLLNRSVRENVSLPLEYHSKSLLADHAVDERVQSVAEELGIAGALDLRGAAVNGSVARAALYARAFVLDADILLVDEAQASLSPRLRALASEAIERRRNAGKLTVVYADHDGSLAPFVATRRVYLIHGTVYDTPPAHLDVSDRTFDSDAPPSFVPGSGGSGS